MLSVEHLQGKNDIFCEPSLNLTQVNRFHMLEDIGKRKEDTTTMDVKVDLISGLLMHNMVELVEFIFDLLGLRQTWTCRQVRSKNDEAASIKYKNNLPFQVNQLWNQFITDHIFKRWAFQMAKDDPLLSQDLTQHLKLIQSDSTNDLYYGNICRNLHNLRDRWRQNQPKHFRVNCDSFVLSVVITKSPKTFKPFLYCGLNNGDLQLWTVSDNNLYSKIREMEVHRKGVKVRLSGH